MTDVEAIEAVLKHQHILGSYLLWRLLTKWRIRLGARILGDKYIALNGRLWLVRERAMRAVHEDGTVTLAECESLAEALYAPLDGTWRMTLERIDVAGDANG